MALIGEMQYLTIGGNTYSLPSGGGGSVTSVAVSNATNGGLSVSGSPISSSGTITIGHSNVLSSAQTTQAVYPIKIDKNGHISAYGTAINLSEYAQLTGASFTGPVTFGNSVTADELETGDLVVTGAASFTNNINANTINGVAVGNSPKFTDTVTTVTTTGSGNAITAISATNGAITATKGTTFLTSHQDISGKADKSATVSNVAYDSTNAKITKTINGTTSDVVTVATLKSALGSMPASDVYSWAKASTKPTYTASEVGALASNTTYVSTVTTTAGTHSAISSKSGAVSFNVPTKTSHLTNDSGFITSYTDEKVKITALTDASTYYLTGNNSFVTNTGGLDVHESASLAISANSSTNGYTRLQLGNNTASTSAGGKEGVLRLYGTSTSYTDLKVGASTSAKTITFPDKTGTVALTSDIPTVPSNIVNTITTTAGTHTAISSQTGTVSFNVPTKTSHLTNDSGYITASHTSTYSLPLAASGTRGGVQIGYSESGTNYAVKLSSEKMYVSVPWTDTKVTNTAATAATTYYLTGSTSSTTATGGLSKHASLAAYTTADTATSGYTQLRLGNTTVTSSAGGKEGQIRLYGTTATYYVDLKAGAPSANRTITFPNKTGTVALTSDIPTVSYPVTSVNSKTGAVSLSASDVSAVSTSQIVCGYESLSSTVAAGSYADITVSFGQTFSTIPRVVCGFDSTSTAGTFGRCSCAVHDRTTTGCKIRFFNGDSSARQPGFDWIAFI